MEDGVHARDPGRELEDGDAAVLFHVEELGGVGEAEHFDCGHAYAWGLWGLEDPVEYWETFGNWKLCRRRNADCRADFDSAAGCMLPMSEK